MDVIERAKGQLELMLGAARIESGSDSLFASLSGILYQKSADGIIPKRLSLLTATMSIGSRIRISIGEYGDSRAYMKAAERDEHLNFAVRLWADSSRTWPRLYRIVEEIYVSFRDKDKEYPSAVLLKRGIIDFEDDYRRFAKSANEAEFAGPDSRHAMYNNKVPKEAQDLPFLPHAEALSFVRECLKRALVLRSGEE
jgi:hypothetical protein